MPAQPAAAAPWSLYVWDEIAAEDRARILGRAAASSFAADLLGSVQALIDDVRARGDAAVCDALERYDGVAVTPDTLRVGAGEIEAAAGRVARPLAEAIRYGIANIRRFNARQLAEREWTIELAPGVSAGERLRPIESAGLYVPAGKGSFPSVLMQTGTPAVVAGVPEIAVVVPPTSGAGGAVDDAVLFVARELGLENVFRANGPAGIAALAYGTETFPRVRMIAGPGSPPITAAQILVQLAGVRTQLLFGPSESMIIADEHAAPDWIAADMLNEAEHGPDSASLLVTPSTALVGRVAERIAPRLAELPEPRRGWAARSLRHFGGVILVEDLAQAATVANAYAPEHMIVDVAEPDALLGSLADVGEILIGPWTPISAANYAIGVPAALPTGGYAKVSSGLTARAFMRSTSIARLSEQGLRAMADAVLTLADHEAFPAHAASVTARLGGARG